jgi:ElaA protein
MLDMHLQWVFKKFAELNVFELYNILQLRSEVFVVEQNCPYLDADNNDQDAYHLSAYNNDKIVAYTRIIKPGNIYKEASIGRVVTSPTVRRTGIGKILMEKSIESVEELYGKVPIKIGAQLYLKNFYSSLGFIQVSDMYLEDGIEHIYMLRYPQT